VLESFLPKASAIWGGGESRRMKASVIGEAGRAPFQLLQVLQSKCLCIATNAPWYVGNRQIHEDLGIPFSGDHIRALTESFDSKLTDAGNPLVRQLGRHLCRPSAD
jgi:hypothetical protein